MVTKMARAKQPGSKQRREEREANWERVYAIWRMEKPYPVDIWWMRKFLKFVMVNPFVEKSFGKVYDEGPTARGMLAKMERLWPEDREKEKPKKEPEQQKSRSEAHIKILRKSLRKAQIEVKPLERKSDWWERKLNRTSIADKQWTEIRDKTHAIREELKQLKLKIERLKKALP